MKRQMILIAAIAAAGVLATSCQRENTTGNTGNPVEFRALIDKTDNSRASLVDATPQLTSFFVAAGLNVGNNPQSSTEVGQVEYLDFMQAAVWKTHLNQGGDQITWSYAPKKYFPTDGQIVNFYAYAPIKDINMIPREQTDRNSTPFFSELQAVNSIGGGEVWFEYTVPADQSKSNTAVDLLVAKASGSSASPQQQVAFNFDHALSAVTFSAWNKNPEDSELVYIIHEIRITNLDNMGTYNYTSGWDNHGITGDGIYKAGVPESGVSVMPVGSTSVSYVNLLSKNDIMMVLPQDCSGSGSNVEITYSLKDGSGYFVYKNEVLSLPLYPSLTAFTTGTLYNFQFNFSVLEPITFDVTVKNWSDETPVPLNP